MIAILQTTFPNAFYGMKQYGYRFRFHWSLFLKSPIKNIPALIHIMAWWRLGDKPLSESMMVRYGRIYVSLGLGGLTENKMTSWHVDAFHIVGPLWGNPQDTGGFPSQKANNAELGCWPPGYTKPQRSVGTNLDLVRWMHCYHFLYSILSLEYSN